ncbi:hypothetical protein ACFQMM_13725 [Saliphagus sp. GCM10025308]
MGASADDSGADLVDVGDDLDGGAHRPCPRPTNEEAYHHGWTLSRRRMLQATAGAATAGALGATASIPAAAQSSGIIIGNWGTSNPLAWMFGDDDDDEEYEEYLENEVLRIHGDMYRYGVEETASTETALTWLTDNVTNLEGKAYIEGLKSAYRAIQDDGATRQEAIDEATKTVDVTYSIPQGS